MITKGVKDMKKLSFVIALLMLFVCALSSCEQVPPENMEFPKEDCVMVYTISETEYIRILLQRDSDFCNYGEWVNGDSITPVYLRERPIHATHGLAGYEVYIEEFNPNEKDHVHTSECKHIEYMFEKGVLNSSYLINLETEEKISFTYSTENDLDFYFSWVSDTLIAFKNTEGKIYKEQNLNFWYDFDSQKGEWKTNDKIVPIRMKFTGITPFSVHLGIYDVSSEQEKLILGAWGELTDENTLSVNLMSEDNNYHLTNITNQMFYEGTVSQLIISRVDKE